MGNKTLASRAVETWVWQMPGGLAVIFYLFFRVWSRLLCLRNYMLQTYMEFEEDPFMFQHFFYSAA